MCAIFWVVVCHSSTPSPKSLQEMQTAGDLSKFVSGLVEERMEQVSCGCHGALTLLWGYEGNWRNGSKYLYTCCIQYMTEYDCANKWSILYTYVYESHIYYVRKWNILQNLFLILYTSASVAHLREMPVFDARLRTQELQETPQRPAPKKKSKPKRSSPAKAWLLEERLGWVERYIHIHLYFDIHAMFNSIPWNWSSTVCLVLKLCPLGVGCVGAQEVGWA